MQFTEFDQVVHFMEHYTNLEKKTDQYSRRTYRLDRMTALMNHLGNPQLEYRMVHVAGSKGKGSTASYIASGLEAAGFRVGLYMSPHVTDYRERFTLCGRFFDDELLVSTGNILAEKLQDFSFDDRLGDTSPTTFELYTAYAFMLFKYSGCQWAVIETGLGGRLDATNIIMPKACVLTPVELEHTEILGDTIEKIATEKSKIIKDCVPTFVAMQKQDAYRVFENEARERHSSLYLLSDNILEMESENSARGQKAHIVYTDGFEVKLNLRMLGDVQVQNCALALMVLRKLGMYKPGVTEKALEYNVLPGRMERISLSRNFYLDGAHTQNSIGNTVRTFREIYPVKPGSPKSGVCIFGAVAGKNHDAMGHLILDNFDKIIVCRPGTYKKSDVKALYELLLSMKTSQTIELRPEAGDAVELAKKMSTKEEGIMVCGSFYLTGAIKEVLCP